MRKLETTALVVALVMSLTGCTTKAKNQVTVKEQATDRAQELLIEGANAIAGGRYNEGIILLNTMVNTYPDSSLVNAAKLLVDCSFKLKGASKDEEVEKGLEQIREILKKHENNVLRFYTGFKQE